MLLLGPGLFGVQGDIAEVRTGLLKGWTFFGLQSGTG